ncbi:TolC family protein [uncultured Oxalicibacterium sp.]|uniref:TolC family protein n=1 Tax=uncultured Oxalicibacterium sp. TaxID=1168540 RepID=UPI0025F58AC5|nr:TolC family protein [uncultured Oxalicibacterium sp.]
MYRVSLSCGMLALALMPVPRLAMAQTDFPPPGMVAGNGISIGEMRSHPAAEAASLGVLALPQALAMAFASSPELSAARHESAAVAATIRQAGIIPNPSVSMAVEDRRRDTRTTSLELSQPIELGGKRSARIAAATRAYDTSQADLAARVADIRANVITAFFSVLYAQERLKLAQAALTIAESGSRVAGRRVQAGKVSPVEETRARVAEAGVRLDVTQATTDLNVARRKLAATWGNPAARFGQVVGDAQALPVVPSWNELEQRMQDAPLARRARAEIERWQAQVEVEKSKRIPDVSVSLGMQRNNELGRDQALFGVSLPLPLFDRNQGNLLEALRRADKARDEAQVTLIRLDADVTQAYEMLRNATQQTVTLQRDMLPGAQSAYDAAVRGFEFGKFNFLDVLDAQRTLLQTRSQYLRALADAHTAAADIDRWLGMPEDAVALPSAASNVRDAIRHANRGTSHETTQR